MEKDNYIQRPSNTLEMGTGDCEDQAITVYAMLEYYEKNVRNKNYNKYLVNAEAEDGGNHAFIIIPYQDGKITFLDPVYNYYTNNNGNTLLKKLKKFLMNMKQNMMN